MNEPSLSARSRSIGWPGVPCIDGYPETGDAMIPWEGCGCGCGWSWIGWCCVSARGGRNEIFPFPGAFPFPPPFPWPFPAPADPGVLTPTDPGVPCPCPCCACGPVVVGGLLHEGGNRPGGCGVRKTGVCCCCCCCCWPECGWAEPICPFPDITSPSAPFCESFVPGIVIVGRAGCPCGCCACCAWFC